MPLASHAIEQDSLHMQSWVESRIARRHGRCRACHGTAVDHQQDRSLQLFGQFGRAALFMYRGTPVKEAHHPFNNGHIRTGRRL